MIDSFVKSAVIWFGGDKFPIYEQSLTFSIVFNVFVCLTLFLLYIPTMLLQGVGKRLHREEEKIVMIIIVYLYFYMQFCSFVRITGSYLNVFIYVIYSLIFFIINFLIFRHKTKVENAGHVDNENNTSILYINNTSIFYMLILISILYFLWHYWSVTNFFGKYIWGKYELDNLDSLNNPIYIVLRKNLLQERDKTFYFDQGNYMKQVIDNITGGKSIKFNINGGVLIFTVGDIDIIIHPDLHSNSLDAVVKKISDDNYSIKLYDKFEIILQFCDNFIY